MSKNRASLFEFRKQASFFIKEKIKTARLALTDVTPAQLLTEEATNANSWAPDARTLGLISKSAFEVDDYWRIVEILHNKLSNFDRKNWRASYNALIVLEYLLTHGPESVAEEFQTEKPIIKDMENFTHVDERGFDWGLAVRKKSERTLKLLEKGPFLKEERENSRKIKREIKGFGSFSGSGRTTKDSSLTSVGRSHSQFNEHGNDDENFLPSNTSNQPSLISLGGDQDANPEISRIMKGEEGNALLCGGNRDRINGGVLIEEKHHPFYNVERLSKVSLLATQAED